MDTREIRESSVSEDDGGGEHEPKERGIPIWMSFFRLEKKNEGNGVLGPETSSRVIVALPSSSAYNAGGDIRAASNRSPPFRPDLSSECRLIWPPIEITQRTGRMLVLEFFLSSSTHSWPREELEEIGTRGIGGKVD